MLCDSTDFELPGPVPLAWKRSWFSDSSLKGHLNTPYWADCKPGRKAAGKKNSSTILKGSLFP